MYVTTDKPIQRLKSEHTNGEFVEFSDTGTAQVTEDVGTALCNHYDDISEK